MRDKATRVYRVLAHRNIRFKSLLNLDLCWDSHRKQPLTKYQLLLNNNKKFFCLPRLSVQNIQKKNKVNSRKYLITKRNDDCLTLGPWEFGLTPAST